MKFCPSRTPPPVDDVERVVPSRERDFREWHLGRPRFAVWAIALADRAVDDRLQHLRADLKGLLCSGYNRQPHITLHVCGFPAATRTRADDFGLDQLQAHLSALQQGTTQPFDLRVGGAFSFSAAACLSVEEPGNSLQRLRAAWHDVAPTWDATPYRPHVTAGFYSGAWRTKMVHARMKAHIAIPAIPLRIRHVDWMCYDSDRIAGPLRTLLRYDLENGQVQVADEGQLRSAFGSRSFPRGATAK